MHKKIQPAPSFVQAQGEPLAQPWAWGSKNIYLIGLRASGKTSVGRAVAQKLKCTFVDTDDLVTKMSGQSIAQLVATQGWDFFRNQEKKALIQAATLPNKVIATGGGIILNPQNREFLKSTGIVFFLAAEPSLLVQRLTHSPGAEHRPPLSTKTLVEEIQATWAERQSLYLTTMDHKLDAQKSITTLVEDIFQILKAENSYAQ